LSHRPAGFRDEPMSELAEARLRLATLQYQYDFSTENCHESESSRTGISWRNGKRL
jgi:hypothetical protein